MDIIEKKTIDHLTTEGVSILTQKFTTVDGIETQVGENHRCAYSNSASGRNFLTANEPAEVVETILTVWGSEPTVEEPEIPVTPTPTKEELLEERLAALETQNETLAAQNALLESCILEMSEIVYAE